MNPRNNTLAAALAEARQYADTLQASLQADELELLTAHQFTPDEICALFSVSPKSVKQ